MLNLVKIRAHGTNNTVFSHKLFLPKTQKTKLLVETPKSSNIQKQRHHEVLSYRAGDMSGKTEWLQVVFPVHIRSRLFPD